MHHSLGRLAPRIQDPVTQHHYIDPGNSFLRIDITTQRRSPWLLLFFICIISSFPLLHQSSEVTNPLLHQICSVTNPLDRVNQEIRSVELGKRDPASIEDPQYKENLAGPSRTRSPCRKPVPNNITICGEGKKSKSQENHVTLCPAYTRGYRTTEDRTEGEGATAGETCSEVYNRDTGKQKQKSEIERSLHREEFELSGDTATNRGCTESVKTKAKRRTRRRGKPASEQGETKEQA